MRDLVVLVPDADIEATINALLNQPAKLGTRKIDFKMIRHPQRDAGCRTGAADFLRSSSNQFHYAMVIFDRDGCGVDGRDAAVRVQEEVQRDLERNGWPGRARVVVIEPELEQWVWANSREVEQVIWRREAADTLRPWLIKRGFLAENRTKPVDPKTAFREALAHVKQNLSPSLFKELAERVPLKGCTDPALNRLLETLRAWFPPQ